MIVRHLTRLALIILLIEVASPQGMGESDVYPTGYGLAGQVVDVSGSGLPGVKVWAIRNDGGAINTTTNATGYYGFNVSSGNYTIMAELPGYSFASSTAQIEISNISVTQRIIGYPVAASYPATTSYPGGITGYPGGTVPATAAPYQYGTQYAPGVAGGGVGWLQGRVVDQSGAGIPSASIAVDGFQASAITDAQGNYRLALSPGIHRIEAMKSGYGIPPRMVFISSGQTTNFDLMGKGMVSLGRGVYYLDR